MIPARVLVINRAADTARMLAFDRRWHAATGGARYERVDAVDRPADPAAGLYESHLRALNRSPGPLLILEDDAVFTAAFTLDLPDPPPGWLLARLGGELRQVAFADVPRRARGPWAPVAIAHHTHAYVVSRPADLAELIRARPADIGAALMWVVPGHYRLIPGTVGQAAGPSTISADRDRPADQFWEP